MKRPLVFASVPKIWERGTCLVLGSGPSLTRDDVRYAAARVDGIIAVNDAYRHIPDCLALYAADAKWWKWHQGCVATHSVGRTKYPAFTGTYRYTLGEPAYPHLQLLKKGPETGLSLDPHTVALGRNGAYQAINVARHFGATRIILLGVDMQGQPNAHDFGRHPDNTGPPFEVCIQRFTTLVAPLKAAGIQVINCTRSTAVKAFPRMALEDALKAARECPRAEGPIGIEGVAGIA